MNHTWNDDKDLYPAGDVRNMMTSKTARIHMSTIARVTSFPKDDLTHIPIVRTYTEEEEARIKKIFIDDLSTDLSREDAEFVVNDIWKCAKNLISRNDLKDIIKNPS